jgi:hypothetical protein
MSMMTREPEYGNVPGDRGHGDDGPGTGAGARARTGTGPVGERSAPAFQRGSYMVVPADGSTIGVVAPMQFGGFQLQEGRYQG